MNVNKQLINLAGILIIVAVLVIGVVVVAMPMVGQAQDTDSQTRTVSEANAVYDIQVAHLTRENDRIVEIDASLAALRTSIAATPQLDDVFEIINAAATGTAASIQSVRVADPTAWTARASVVDAIGSGVPIPAATPAPEVTEDPVADDAQPGGEPQPAPVATPDAMTSPQLQVVVTIQVAVPDALVAAAFVDALAAGDRLLTPISNRYLDGVLTVEALAFIRTEEAR